MPVKRILVTGGAGYAGSLLVRTLLDYGYSVRVLDDLCAGKLSNLPVDRCQLSLVVGDTTDAAAVARAMKDCDAVIHLAALDRPAVNVDDPIATDQNSFVGTLNICETMRQFGVKRVVFASMEADPTASAGECPAAVADERLATEHFIDFYRLQHGLEPVMVQLGSRRKLTAALTHEGRKSRELADASEAVRALMKAVGAMAPHAEPINDRTGQALKYQRNER